MFIFAVLMFGLGIVALFIAIVTFIMSLKGDNVLGASLGLSFLSFVLIIFGLMVMVDKATYYQDPIAIEKTENKLVVISYAKGSNNVVNVALRDMNFYMSTNIKVKVERGSNLFKTTISETYSIVALDM